MKKGIILILIVIPLIVIAAGKYKEGFQNLKWGDSLEKVQKEYPDGEFLNGAYVITKQVTGSTAIVMFTFYKNRLFQGMILYNIVTKDASLAKYGEVKSLLMDKYGEPVSQKEEIDSQKKVMWNTNESNILLKLTTIDDKYVVGIGYYCRELGEEKQNEDNKKHKSEL